jgi:hypothetical protein
MKNIFLAVGLLCAAFTASAQRGFQDSNRIGITAGVNQTTLATNNFPATPGIGWNGGLSMRGNFYNDFDMVYAMQFSENKFSVKTLNQLAAIEEVEYKLPGVQISLMLSYKISGNNLTIEAGPVLQINGKLDLEEENANNLIQGTTLLAKDIAKVNTFNFNLGVGITGGITNLRANLQYQYGVSNILNNLNEQHPGHNFNGHLGILSGNIIVYL